jgi:hypothetical protein
VSFIFSWLLVASVGSGVMSRLDVSVYSFGSGSLSFDVNVKRDCLGGMRHEINTQHKYLENLKHLYS